MRDFSSIRAKIKYTGCSSRSDLCSGTLLLAISVPQPTKSEFNALNKFVERCYQTSHIGLRYVPLDVDSLRLIMLVYNIASPYNITDSLRLVLPLDSMATTSTTGA